MLPNTPTPKVPKLLPLEHIRNIEGFQFTGIDKDFVGHSCEVSKGSTNSYYMHSATTTFKNLIGWVPSK
jgi:hypothetical protein